MLATCSLSPQYERCSSISLSDGVTPNVHPHIVDTSCMRVLLSAASFQNGSDGQRVLRPARHDPGFREVAKEARQREQVGTVPDIPGFDKLLPLDDPLRKSVVIAYSGFTFSAL